MAGFVGPVEDVSAHFCRPIAAIYGRAPVAEGGPLPCFGCAGTGGFEGVHFILNRQGYAPYIVRDPELVVSLPAYAPFAELMKEVQAGFGRTMSHLPAVFGVSRQTLYNWIRGELPNELHQNKIVQLAAAAYVFREAGFKLTSLMLDRTVVRGKSFVELIAEGADGKEAAERLVRIVKRGATSREKLDLLLADRPAGRLEISDMGRPSFNEDG